jgi:hypothetical protein
VLAGINACTHNAHSAHTQECSHSRVLTLKMLTLIMLTLIMLTIQMLHVADLQLKNNELSQLHQNIDDGQGQHQHQQKGHGTGLLQPLRTGNYNREYKFPSILRCTLCRHVCSSPSPSPFPFSTLPFQLIFFDNTPFSFPFSPFLHSCTP